MEKSLELLFSALVRTQYIKERYEIARFKTCTHMHTHTCVGTHTVHSPKSIYINVLI